MPLRSPLYSQRSLVLTLVALLGAGFLATSLLSYFASRESIRDNIVNTELPLTSDTVYSEIQKDLVRPILISSMMSRDTFMRDWVVNGEQNPEQMTRYLDEVMTHYGAYTAFFVSMPRSPTTTPKACSSRSKSMNRATPGTSACATCRTRTRSTSTRIWPTRTT